jgi:hypothetical protein
MTRGPTKAEYYFAEKFAGFEQAFDASAFGRSMPQSN